MEDIRREVGLVRRADGRRFAVKLAILAVLTAGGVGLITVGSPWSTAAGIVLCGLMYAHAVELQHEALHGIGFRTMRANTVAGILLGLPLLTSFAAYQASHMRHHRLLGTPQNKEFFDYGDQYGAGTGNRFHRTLLWVYRFSMVSHFLGFFWTAGKLAAGRTLSEEKPTAMRGIRRDYAIMIALIVTVVAATLVTGSRLALWIWLAPLAVAGPVHAAIEFPEHYRCQTLTTDVFQNTRTIRSNRLAAWFTNGNNFHVEHHLMPSLPIHQLGELHGRLKGRHHYYHRTYRDFIRSLRAPQGTRPDVLTELSQAFAQAPSRSR
ncbi:fatty acid desaturase family protein [Catenulispora subtropica]|uniref:Fatty acid desaturase n=1 Tax=Catenulispora subtropica TaxID=450798 RepID=A0ABN2S8B3_9ACTN